jgi:hypothetical protein
MFSFFVECLVYIMGHHNIKKNMKINFNIDIGEVKNASPKNKYTMTHT